MTKQEKIQKLAAALLRRGRTKEEGETDVQFVTRIMTARVAKFRETFIKQAIREQIAFESPVEDVDVSDM